MTMHCPECGTPNADVAGQPCPMCWWGLGKSRDEEEAVSEAEVLNALTQRDAALKRVKELEAENEELRGKLMTQEAGHWCEHEHRVRACEMLEEAESQRDAYKAQRDDLAAQIDAMGDVEELRETIRGLKDDLSHAEERYEKLKARNHMLVEENQGLGANCSSQARDLHNLRIDLGNARARIAELESNAGRVHATGCDLSDENEEIRSEVKRLTRLALDLAAVVAGKGVR